MNPDILLIFSVHRILMKVNTINQRLHIKVNIFYYLKKNICETVLKVFVHFGGGP